MKRFKVISLISLLCVVVMLSITACTDNFAPNGKEDVPSASTIEGDLKFTQKSDGTYSVAPVSRNISGELNIPATYNGKSVTAVGGFEECVNLTSVIIPNSVTTIYNFAFKLCSGLTHVVIPDNVDGIAWYAFSGCSGLKGEVIIPSGVTFIGVYAFNDCNQLTSVTIPNSVTKLYEGAFKNCTSLAEIKFLGTSAEWANVKLEKNAIPSSTTIVCVAD